MVVGARPSTRPSRQVVTVIGTSTEGISATQNTMAVQNYRTVGVKFRACPEDMKVRTSHEITETSI